MTVFANLFAKIAILAELAPNLCRLLGLFMNSQMVKRTTSRKIPDIH